MKTKSPPQLSASGRTGRQKRTPCQILLAACALAAILASGCTRKEDPILILSAEEALDIGKSYMADEKYERARRHLIHAFEVEPNSRIGREALLLAADALYLYGGTDNYIKCEAKYRDFLNRFPTSDRADYAQFKVAECLAARAERPDRDQRMTRSAIEALQELLRLYPTSTYVADARQRMRELNDQLAAHELVVATFYNRYAGVGICVAAINRLEPLREEYPQFSRMDEALIELAKAYRSCRRPDDAVDTLRDLRRRYPDSTLLGQADKELAALSKEGLQRAEAAEKDGDDEEAEADSEADPEAAVGVGTEAEAASGAVGGVR